MSDADTEARVGLWLCRQGVISERALEHALALRLRGLEKTPIGEILVELGHVEPTALASALAQLSGCERWDGEQLDVAASETDVAAGELALIVSRERGMIRYATPEPYDERLREAIRFRAGVARAEPLAATEEQIAHAKMKIEGFDLARQAQALPSARPVGYDDSEAAERAWRDGFTDHGRENTPALIRFVNLILMRAVWPMPGGVLRIELFDRPALRFGRHGRFEHVIAPDVPPGTHYPLLVCSAWRLKQMAEIPAGHGPASGHFQLQVGKRVRSFEVLVEPTLAGNAVVLQRYLMPLGLTVNEAIVGSSYARLQAEAQQARAVGRLDLAEAPLRAALAQVEAAGPAATLELLSTLQSLAEILDLTSRDAEAAPLVRRALELAQRFELGQRVEADLLFLLARTEVGDMRRRAEALAAAEQKSRSPGPSPLFAGWIGFERIFAERMQKNGERAVERAERLCHEEEAWFGAPTERSFDALIVAAHAEVDRERIEAARLLLERARAINAAIAIADGPAACAWVEGRLAAASDDLEEAARLLASALDDPGRRMPGLIGADLALVLERLGRVSEARATASTALSELGTEDGFAVRERVALEALLRRAGPYR